MATRLEKSLDLLAESISFAGDAKKRVEREIERLESHRELLELLSVQPKIVVYEDGTFVILDDDDDKPQLGVYRRDKNEGVTLYGVLTIESIQCPVPNTGDITAILGDESTERVGEELSVKRLSLAGTGALLEILHQA